MGELIGHVLATTAGALIELICVQTARVVLPIISFGVLTTQPSPSHPPAYGERRPVVVGELVSLLFGITVWTLVAAALIGLLR